MDLYGFDGQPISREEWMRLFEDIGERQVGYDRCGPYEISTVWLGIDHGFGMTARPLIYETMVFDEGRKDVDCFRHATRDEAVAEHRRQIERYSVLVR
jgi:hypothetical protein